MSELALRVGCSSVLDVGAGGGELLAALDLISGGELTLCGVDLHPRPPGLPARIGWRDRLPERIEGLVVANEWLDNIACDVVEVDEAGVARVVHVDPCTGEERLGAACDDPWLGRWWPLSEPGQRAEVGTSRDAAWAELVERLEGGMTVAVDYGHTRDTRPPRGTLTSYRHGRQVPPVPDGSRDLTAHVAVDSLGAYLVSQREALRWLGVSGSRPPVGRAEADPAGYVAALARASEAGELTATGGLGDFFWISSHPLDPG